MKEENDTNFVDEIVTQGRNVYILISGNHEIYLTEHP